ncbi:MAG TPA: DUF1800 family protein, partial [Pyrinomonadaceae bacterium]|nr:DUF1800 family protein [Pyrinomonadaceae bacterium]
MSTVINSPISFFIRIFLSLGICTLIIVQPCAALAAAPEPTGPILTADQRVSQALLRLSFGVRPGDFEAVKKIGVAKYIEQQLDPESIDDSALDKRLAKLPTLTLPTPTMAEQYNPPKPPVVAAPGDTIDFKVVNGEQFNFKATVDTEGKLAVPFTDKPLLVQNLNENDLRTALTKALGTRVLNPQVSLLVSKIQPPAPTPGAPTPSPTPTPKNPNMVVTDLQRAKIMRAVYSERQLYEMVVDFWENHFSIYANKDADRWMLTSFDRDS